MIFALYISCLTTSNLSWFTNPTFQVLRSIVLHSIGLYFHIQITFSHIHYWASFLLWLLLFILSGAISLVLSSSILNTNQHGSFIFQCYIFLPFHTVHGVLMARMLKWFAILFSSSVQFSHWVMSDSLQPHGLQHTRPPCPSPIPGVYSNSCPLSR